jgi:hypothetical protein
MRPVCCGEWDDSSDDVKASSELAGASEGTSGDGGCSLSVELGRSLSEEPSGVSSVENPRRIGGVSLSEEPPGESPAFVDGLSVSLFFEEYLNSSDGVVKTGKSSAITLC